MARCALNYYTRVSTIMTFLIGAKVHQPGGLGSNMVAGVREASAALQAGLSHAGVVTAHLDHEETNLSSI